MKTRLSHIFIAIMIMAVASLACQTVLGGATDEDVPEIEPVPEQAEPSVTEPEAADAKEENPEKALDVQLGDEFHSEDGGYSFSAIPGYDVEEFFGVASMEAPNADPVSGPSILMFGGLNDENKSLEQIFDEFSQDMSEGEGDQPQIMNKRTVTIAGVEMIVADLEGTAEGQAVAGRIAVALPTPTQQFTMFGSTPADEWDEFRLNFDAVLNSVTFFEPTEIEFNLEEDEAVADAADEIRQWASTATASSQYDTPNWAATQATGEPDTLIDYCGTVNTAWASYDGYSVEWIELSYDEAVIPTEINIIQTSAPNQVVEVEVIDTEGSYESVYTGVPEKIIEGCPYTLSVTPDVDYQVNGVRIAIDQTVLEYPWNEIDAVELVGNPAGDEMGAPPSATGNVEGVLWRAGGERGSDEGQIGGLGGMDLGPDGHLYIADETFGVRVLNVDDGSLVILINHDDLWQSSDVQVGPEGNIYVADWGANEVFVFSSDGELLTQFGEDGNGPGQFGTFSPDSLAVGPDGDLYVLDDNTSDAEEEFTRIQVFSADGTYLREFPVDFEDPSIEDMDFGPDGNLYLVDWFGDVLLQYAPDGTFLSKVGEDALYFASPQDVAIDEAGNFYVAIWSPEGVIKLDPTGNVVGQFGADVEDGENPWMEGLFYSVSGVAVTPDGSSVFASDWSGYYAYVTAFEFK